MRLAYLLALPLLTTTALGCAHTPEPPAGAALGYPLAAMADVTAQQVAPGAQRVAPVYESATKEEDGHVDWNVPLVAGQCYYFIGIGSPNVKHLYLYLWNQREERVATEKPDQPQVTLRYCPTQEGLYHLQAKTAEGYGPFGIGIYTQANQAALPPQQQLGPPPMAPPPMAQ